MPLSGTGSCLGKVCFKMPLERVECVTDRDRKEVPAKYIYGQPYIYFGSSTQQNHYTG